MSNKWYRSARWQKLRKAQLSRHPYCQCPHHKNHRIPADTVDHIQPHKGDPKLFWSTANLQSLTKRCHDAAKQVRDKSGYWPGAHLSGEPEDPEHPWNLE